MGKPVHWLIKSEPSVYSFRQLEQDGRTAWTGIRSFEARNNLRAMTPGDLCLFYHSNEGKEIVGIAKVLTAAGPDPTAPGEDWASVDVAPVRPLVQPVTLAVIKATSALADCQLVTRSRLSVVPVKPAHFARILKLGKTKLT
jgi:predicted RNA-binding protein with PUA-like domain